MIPIMASVITVRENIMTMSLAKESLSLSSDWNTGVIMVMIGINSQITK